MAQEGNTDSKRAEWVIIGISGVTCGGKTTLARRLRAALAPARVYSQDRYFYPDSSPRHVRCAGLRHNNYDILSALDMDAMRTDILQTIQGSGETSPAPAGTEAAAEAGAEAGAGAETKFQLEGKKFLVVEGFTVLNYRPIMELCDLRYYLTLEYGECARRRVLRLYEPPDVAGYFEQCVWPEHLRYRAEIEKDNRVKLLDGTDPNVFETVMADIRAMALPAQT